MSDINKPLDPLLDLLVQNGVLDDAQVDTILEESKNPTGKTLRQLLIDGEYVMEDDLLGMMAAYQGCDVIITSLVIDELGKRCLSICIHGLKLSHVFVSQSVGVRHDRVEA